MSRATDEWHNRDTVEEFHWCGRTRKIYVEAARGWEMISQVGALDYRELVGG